MSARSVAVNIMGTDRSRASRLPGWIPRALSLGIASGVAASLGSTDTVLGVAGASVLADTWLSAVRRRVVVPPLFAVCVAAAALGPLFAATRGWDLALVAGGIALAAIAWSRPIAGLIVLIVAAPLHSLAMSVLERRWLWNVGALGCWKDLLVLALAARSARDLDVDWIRRWLRSAVGRWFTALAALAVTVSLGALATHRVGVGLAVRGLAADFGPMVLLPAAALLSRSANAEDRVRRWVVALGVAFACFGFVQIVAIGPSWYAAMGYFGPRDFKVPGHEVFRLTSVFLDPLPAGQLLGVAALLALDDLMHATTRRRQILFATSFAPCLLGSIASFTRSSWLGLAVGVVLIAWQAGRTGSRRKVVAALAIATASVLPLAPRLAAWTRDTVTRAENDTSVPRHLQAWTRGVRTIVRNPLGLGPGRAGEVSVRILGGEGIVTESTYLQLGVEYGLLALVLFTAWVWSVARDLGAVAFAATPGAAGIFASWVFLAIGAIFLHAFTERAVAYPVFALAGLLLGRTPVAATSSSPASAAPRVE